MEVLELSLCNGTVVFYRTHIITDIIVRLVDYEAHALQASD